MNILAFKKSIYELIINTSTNLPQDVRQAILHAKNQESIGSLSAMGLDMIALNIDIADKSSLPICQDTGMPIFYIKTPININQIELKQACIDAIKMATKDGYLRPNSVDSLSGENSGDNVGSGTPSIKFEQWYENEIEVKLMLKGGGSENKSIQYSLPCEISGLGKADRDLDGIRKCILHSVFQAQGQGCSPGFIGVGIGNDRSSGFELAKEQLFREVTDINPNEDLRKLEEYIMEKANTFEIGTMGFGGKSTLLACKIGANNRLPASFFVSVAYNCWALRRAKIRINPLSGQITKYDYCKNSKFKIYI